MQFSAEESTNCFIFASENKITAMKNQKLLFTFFLTALSSGFAFAQDATTKVDPYKADSKFIQGNYEAALDDYLNLLENDSKNDKYNYNIAICYLNTSQVSFSHTSNEELIVMSGCHSLCG